MGLVVTATVVLVGYGIGLYAGGGSHAVEVLGAEAAILVEDNLLLRSPVVAPDPPGRLLQLPRSRAVKDDPGRTRSSSGAVSLAVLLSSYRADPLSFLSALARALAWISIWETTMRPLELPSANEGKDYGSCGGEGARSGGVGDLPAPLFSHPVISFSPVLALCNHASTADAPFVAQEGVTVPHQARRRARRRLPRPLQPGSTGLAAGGGAADPA